MIITVHAVWRRAGETVAVATGIEAETEDVIDFGLDWRPGIDLAEAVERDGGVEVEIEDWQIMRRIKAVDA